MYNGYKTFEDIRAWQLARNFRNKIYKITKKFPKDARLFLSLQILPKDTDDIFIRKIFNFVELRAALLTKHWISFIFRLMKNI